MKRRYDTSQVNASEVANKVQLVEVNPNNTLVNTNRVSKKSTTDLVELAMEIQKADTFVYANACNKLQVIAQQQQAQGVLSEAQQNADLHHVACNFVKVPGNVYHLYQRASGQKFFGMLSREEWNSPHKYLGSYRLEYDHSWTPLQHIHQKDAENVLINKILSTSDNPTLQIALEGSPMDM